MADEATPFASSGTCHPFASSAIGWADENGDWLRNTLYLCERTGTISCGACPPFHQSSNRLARLRSRPASETLAQPKSVENDAALHPMHCVISTTIGFPDPPPSPGGGCAAEICEVALHSMHCVKVSRVPRRTRAVPQEWGRGVRGLRARIASYTLRYGNKLGAATTLWNRFAVSKRGPRDPGRVAPPWAVESNRFAVPHATDLLVVSSISMKG